MTDNEILLALSNMLDPIRDDLHELKGRQKKMELTLENVIIPRLHNIESCYVSTYERYKESVEEHETMK